MTPSLPLRTVVADDHRLFRQGLVSLMKTRPDLVRIVGEAQSAEEAVGLCRGLAPDLILLDIFMEPVGGLEAAAVIRKECPRVAVVMLTASEQDEHLETALELGVAGYLLKDLDAADLFDLVEGLSRGEVAMTRTIASRMLQKALNPAPVAESAILSPREMDVLRLVAKGASNGQIARELFITVNTVKAHLARIMDKLQLENRTQVAAYAVRKGLASSSDD